MRRNNLVVIDPGHGGRDPGAVNNDDLASFGYLIEEKHLTLKLAQLVQKFLLQGERLTPLLTREGDYFVSLHQRVERAKGALGFLSIHHNARPIERPGLEVETWYCFDEQRALAEAIQRTLINRLSQVTETIDRGVRRGRFYVLRNLPETPAALVEVGFISDREECIWLNGEENQRVVAEALEEALEEYFI